jgi:hypothetical protein
VYQAKYGYSGAKTEKVVKESVDSAIGEPISFQQFLERNPISLA